jgi:hypothetical protein
MNWFTLLHGALKPSTLPSLTPSVPGLSYTEMGGLAPVSGPAGRPTAPFAAGSRGMAIAAATSEAPEWPSRNDGNIDSEREGDGYGWERWKTLVSVAAYHSFGGEVEASKHPPRWAASIPHAVTSRIAPSWSSRHTAAATTGGRSKPLQIQNVPTRASACKPRALNS